MRFVEAEYYLAFDVYRFKKLMDYFINFAIQKLVSGILGIRYTLVLLGTETNFHK